MRQPVPACIAALLLIGATAATAAPSSPPPDTFYAEARTTALNAGVRSRAAELLDNSLARPSAPAIIARLRDARSDPAFSPVEQDALIHAYLSELRELSPEAVPREVLEWIRDLRPRAVMGHEEGRHHPVPVFNIAAEAQGLLNQWAWQDGHDAVAGPNRLAVERLTAVLAETPQHEPRARGMRRGLQRLTRPELDRLAAACAATPSGCGTARADIELARGHSGWLVSWLAVAAPSDALPRLREVRRSWSREAAHALILSAVSHPDPGVAGWAISDISRYLPKDAEFRRDWGARLVDLLGDEQKGSAAALQLARIDTEDWIEAAAARPLGDLARQRLSLIAEAEALLGAEAEDR
jgi:hypothetical protein